MRFLLSALIVVSLAAALEATQKADYQAELKYLAEDTEQMKHAVAQYQADHDTEIDAGVKAMNVNQLYVAIRRRKDKIRDVISGNKLVNLDDVCQSIMNVYDETNAVMLKQFDEIMTRESKLKSRSYRTSFLVKKLSDKLVEVARRQEMCQKE